MFSCLKLNRQPICLTRQANQGESMETLLDKHWHHMPAEEVADLLGVEPEKGLDVLEVKRRLDHFGENVIRGKRAKSHFERFLLQFHQPLVYILIFAGIISAGLGEWIDASVILGVVLVNALVGFFQEAKAVKALGALAASMGVEAATFRSGAPSRVEASQVVPGDVLILRSGDKVPADLRLFSVRELRIDESTLTGESVPVEKSSVAAEHDAVLADRKCMAYAGTLVSYGQGRGIVVGTGERTEIGRISGLMDAADALETPLTRKIIRFSHILLVAILILAGGAFLLGILRGESASDMFMVAVALAVGAIPEGLPAAVTIILALGVSRMAARKAVVRKLPAVETLGGTTVICSDKTGTLTENQMTVREIFAGGALFEVTGSGYASQGGISRVTGTDAQREGEIALRECLRAGLLCNDSRLVQKDGRLAAEGDPTEAALIVSAEKFGLDGQAESIALPRIDEQPFESELQYMATLHKDSQNSLIYLKGAVETTLERCSRALASDGEVIPIDPDAVVQFQNDMAAKGLRVLALARKQVHQVKTIRKEDLEADMVFLGLQGMIDPPRTEAKAAITACLQAGVAVKMITGDHAVTAKAIGSMLGLGGDACSSDGDCPVMTGREIAEIDDVGLMSRVRDVSVFARVSPEQKLRLVMALQANGEVCAMTGDGVNDAPALKQADIGIAMGISGTETAKEAADMVLTDDNFATIEAAVEEGRCVYANLLKFIAWTLPTNAGEGLVILAALLFGATLPILPVQILWINMTTAGCLGMMLAFEPKEPGIMDRPPRKPDRPILDPVILRRVGTVSVLLLISAFGLFEWAISSGENVEKARTMAVNVFVIVEAFYLFNARSFRRSPFSQGLMTNPWVPVGFGVMLILQLCYTYVPFMNAAFSSAPIGILDWLKIFAIGIMTFVLVEIDKKRLTVTGSSDE